MESIIEYNLIRNSEIIQVKNNAYIDMSQTYVILLLRIYKTVREVALGSEYIL